jgi:succinate-semialdehyde dehydrogenase/glutarate-semialdehyde dehydrogenase
MSAPAYRAKPEYKSVKLFIDNNWLESSDGGTLPVLNPASEEKIGEVAKATEADLERAVTAAKAAFAVWRKMSALERSRIMRNAAALLRERSPIVSPLITLEQGKPVSEAKAEVQVAAETIEWFAEESRRTYGKIVPSRDWGTRQFVIREPFGPVAVFTPWNFPLNQATRKIAMAMSAGCTVVSKPAEEAPACVAEVARAFLDAGLPEGVLNVVYGVPSMISEYLISHPDVRKISFTGSTVVGKKLAALAGQHMKYTTMELGGHAPVLVFEDANISLAAKIMALAKYRNAGQICNSPTRFLIQRGAYDTFVEQFVDVARTLRLGDGLDPETNMGPLANVRRLQAMEEMVEDAIAHGAKLRTGGRRHGNMGYYFEPTVLADVPTTARAMNEEPFGPLALMRPFDSLEQGVAEANRLPIGLAAYAFTRSNDNVSKLSSAIEAGMLSINANLLALPEVHFGGVKDSGYGSEGGSEGVEAFMYSKLIKYTET